MVNIGLYSSIGHYVEMKIQILNANFHADLFDTDIDNISFTIQHETPFSGLHDRQPAPIADVAKMTRHPTYFQKVNRNDVYEDPSLWKSRIIQDCIFDMKSKKVICSFENAKKYSFPLRKKCILLLQLFLLEYQTHNNKECQSIVVSKENIDPKKKSPIYYNKNPYEQNQMDSYNSIVCMTTEKTITDITNIGPDLVNKKQQQQQQAQWKNQQSYLHLQSKIFDLFRRFVLDDHLLHNLPETYPMFILNCKLDDVEKIERELNNLLYEGEILTNDIQDIMKNMRNQLVAIVTSSQGTNKSQKIKSNQNHICKEDNLFSSKSGLSLRLPIFSINDLKHMSVLCLKSLLQGLDDDIKSQPLRSPYMEESVTTISFYPFLLFLLFLLFPILFFFILKFRFEKNLIKYFKFNLAHHSRFISLKKVFCAC